LDLVFLWGWSSDSMGAWDKVSSFGQLSFLPPVAVVQEAVSSCVRASTSSRPWCSRRAGTDFVLEGCAGWIWCSFEDGLQIVWGHGIR
jgi:hypothetical protein